MTIATAPTADLGASEFRFGRVFSRALSILSRNFPRFFLIIAVAELPSLLFDAASSREPGSTMWVILLFLDIALVLVLNQLGQAIVLYAAFQDMRGLPINLMESVRVGLRRLFPVIGVALLGGLLVVLGLAVLIVPGLIVLTAWFVATPACVVERLGPWRSLDRSARLSKGHRWKIFLVLVPLLAAAFIVAYTIDIALISFGTTLVLIGRLVWDAILTAFSATLAVVTYHDLRVAKEGVDTEQIAAVFD